MIFKFHTFGRIDNRQDVFSEVAKAIDQGLENQGKPAGTHRELKNMDNNLKDFLESAHAKFNLDAPETEVNILLVGCNDRADTQSWLGYMFVSGDLLSINPFVDTRSFQNVDMVFLTNLYLKHKSFHQKRVKDSWSLLNTFYLAFYNPYRFKLKNDSTVNFFNNEIKNYTVELLNFEVPGEAPDEVKNAVLIPHFVIEYLERDRGVYLFESKS